MRPELVFAALDWTFLSSLSVQHLELREEYTNSSDRIALRLLRDIRLADSACLSLIFTAHKACYHPPDFFVLQDEPISPAVLEHFKRVRVQFQGFDAVDESGLHRLFQTSSKSGILEVTTVRSERMTNERIFGEAAFLHEGEWTASAEEMEEGEYYY